MVVLNGSFFNELAGRFTGDFFRALVPLAFSWLLAGALMWMGARLSGLTEATLRRAVLTAMAASVTAYACMHELSGVSVGGTPLGVVLGLLMTWMIIQKMLDANIWRVLMVWVFDVLAHFGASLLGITAGGFRWDLSHLVR
jgi:hypothetical protein